MDSLTTLNTSPVNQTLSTHPHTAAQTPRSAKPRFANHTLTYTPESLGVIKKIHKNDCSICLESIVSQPQMPLQMHSCRHIFHKACIEQLALPSRKKCPECRDAKRDTNVYQSVAELTSQLPKQCKHPLCTVRGTEQEITEKTADCPAPLSTFPHLRTHQFLENNSTQIIRWLDNQFREKNYSMHDVSLVNQFYQPGRSNAHGKPAICLSVQFSTDNEPRPFYYSANDINKGSDPEACFKNLLLDLRTDLMMLYLRKSYPAMFNEYSALYIEHYDLWDVNKIYLNPRRDYMIPLTTIFNPETLVFSWDNLKNEFEKQGLDYSLLFKNSHRGGSYPSGRFDSVACNSPLVEVDSFSHQVDLDEYEASVASSSATGAARNRQIDIPTGQLDTSGFLF